MSTLHSAGILGSHRDEDCILCARWRRENQAKKTGELKRVAVHQRRWREVTIAELREIWADQRKRGICYNGCTNDELIRRYGRESVKHARGGGWYKLTAKEN